jgi:hypothetical protein
MLRGVGRLDENRDVARHCLVTPTWRESRNRLSIARPTRSTGAEGSRTGRSQLAVATRERWLAGRAAGVRTIDSGQVAVTSGGHVRLCAADEAPPDGCDFHSHAELRMICIGTRSVRSVPSAACATCSLAERVECHNGETAQLNGGKRQAPRKGREPLVISPSKPVSGYPHQEGAQAHPRGRVRHGRQLWPRDIATNPVGDCDDRHTADGQQHDVVSHRQPRPVLIGPASPTHETARCTASPDVLNCRTSEASTPAVTSEECPCRLGSPRPSLRSIGQ